LEIGTHQRYFLAQEPLRLETNVSSRISFIEKPGEHAWKAGVGFPLTPSATIAQVGLGARDGVLFPLRPSLPPK